MHAVPSQLIRYAQDAARELLASGAPDAWARSERSAAQAARAVSILNRPRGEIIEAAAWLHAIGHSPEIRGSGFAPVDGAVHLLAEGWPTPVINLVAHQGQARLIAPAYGAIEQLTLFERIQGWPSDILDYAIVMAVSGEEHPDPEACLRQAAKGLPASLRMTARDRAERERRLRRAVDRVSAAMVSARSPSPQGA
jgi:hypothetical protein